jgi:hypothetical protein
MTRELGIDDPYMPEPPQTRDGAGRFSRPDCNARGGMSERIRQAASLRDAFGVVHGRVT